MGNKWILDVLTDLQTFAAQNNLPHLAQRLEDTAMLASLEIEAVGQRSTPFVAGRGRRNGRKLLGTLGASEQV